MADPLIIQFPSRVPAPKTPRPKAQIVAHPSLTYRPLGRDLDAVAMAGRLHAMLAAGDQAGAVATWQKHVGQIEAGAKGTATPAQIGRMVAAYTRAVRREIDALKAQ